MKCRQAEELFSDHAEGSLAPPLERELGAHLDSCEECRSLYTAFQDVVSALEAMPVPAPPEALWQRLADSVPGSRRPRRVELLSPTQTHREKRRLFAGRPRLVASASWLAVAAVIAVLLVWRPPELASTLYRKTSRSARQAYSFGVRTYDQTERWIEDLNVLRITVGVAFEDSLERINEQLRDLERAGRESNDDSEQSRELPARPSPHTHQRASIAASQHSSRSPL